MDYVFHIFGNLIEFEFFYTRYYQTTSDTSTRDTPGR